MGERGGAAQALALGDGLYWPATGAWPLVYLPSYLADAALEAALVAGGLWSPGPRDSDDEEGAR